VVTSAVDTLTVGTESVVVVVVVVEGTVGCLERIDLRRCEARRR
jgi:hypothetical protein